jgi:DNA-binding LytR/AlgR family response regulator
MVTIPVISMQNMVRWMPVDLIDFIEMEGRQIKVWSERKPYYLISRNDDLFGLLDVHGFYRTVGKKMVNLRNVQRVNTRYRTATLYSGKVVRLSRANFDFILDRFNKKI